MKSNLIGNNEKSVIPCFLKGFTLIELLVVLIIIGILSFLAIPSFVRTRERALDKEAKVTLKLIQAAEKIYRVKIGVYYPPSGTVDLNALNENLTLSVASEAWDFNITSIGAPVTDFNATANRTARTGWERVWWINASLADPQCISTCSGTCVSNICPP
ncbi:MAG: hypothetical protein A2Y00_08335 [Omnitrophica WOR_2 bacterium GWF2_43_52]|nr:MAG: hypothetical protein A2Y01_00465 [Omnitrophica WOR_2 bacterium GWC2_44_8]OGX21441.1 MAG: hypothetical protein A2Y00_08335 [Omnitrophica WOR_2 bacterium GWF2_43_52]OGX54912.1 MAG: hypothetical protein A2460_00950 [Omnitrophica WOR_2 bacterium RIFOXYC2_FULL_43_9]